MDTQNYNLEAAILTRLRKITRIVRREKMKTSQIYGFTLPQLIVLRYVRENQSVTMSDISNKLGLGNSTTSGIIDRLVTQGMLVRLRNESDRRVINIELTEKAKELTSRIHIDQEEFYQNLFSKLSREDKEQMAGFLDKLYSILTETLPEDSKQDSHKISS